MTSRHERRERHENSVAAFLAKARESGARPVREAGVYAPDFGGTMTAQPVMSPELFELAKALKTRRFQLGLTQRELATKLGCAQTLVSMWESGRRGISFAALTNWAEVLGGEVQLNLSFPPVERVLIKKTLKTE